MPSLLEKSVFEENAIKMIVNRYQDETLVLTDFFKEVYKNELAETAFIGQIHSYTKFGLSPDVIDYSQEEHEFRIVCLNEELDELLDANKENNHGEVIDAIVDYLVFTVGTAYRADYIIETATSLPLLITDAAKELAIDLINTEKLDINEIFHSINKRRVEELSATDFSSIEDYCLLLAKMITSALVLLEHYDRNNEMVTYYRRVLDANNSKKLGGNSKRGSFAIDLVKPEGWEAPSFKGLSLIK